MGKKSCFHGRLSIASNIETMHSSSISCEQAGMLFNSAISIWQKICRRYGQGRPEFWIILDYNRQNPVIASCSYHGIYINLGLMRTNLTVAEDIASRLVEELYHLHEWRVRGIVPKDATRDERISLKREELLAYYARDYKYRALCALAQLTRVPHWKKFLAEVEQYRKIKGL